MSQAGIARDQWLTFAQQQADRFWSKVTRTSDCWLWIAGKDKDGYGKFAITAPRGLRPKQLHVRAHRLSWEMVHGPAPVASVTLHSCDTPACVRPEHLSIGTQALNRLDCVQKSRQAMGEKCYWAKLTAAQVERIRREAASGPVGTQRRLARELGVSKATISHIVTRRSWVST